MKAAIRRKQLVFVVMLVERKVCCWMDSAWECSCRRTGIC